MRMLRVAPSFSGSYLESQCRVVERMQAAHDSVVLLTEFLLKTKAHNN
jgi:hypothetical protein